MNRKQRNNLLGIGLVTFCVVAGTLGIMRQISLKKNHVIGIVRVYDYSIGGRGNAGGIWIDHILQMNGKSYKSSSHYLISEITSEGLKRMVNRTFPALYEPSNPSNCHLVILPGDFKKWGYAFPDSLRWFLPYINDD